MTTASVRGRWVNLINITRSVSCYDIVCATTYILFIHVLPALDILVLKLNTPTPDSLIYHLSLMLFLKFFLRIPVVLLSSPLAILAGLCCGIHTNRIQAIRNDIISFIEEGLFCLHNIRKTEYGTIFCSGGKLNCSDWPWRTVFGENIYLEKKYFKWYGTKSPVKNWSRFTELYYSTCRFE